MVPLTRYPLFPLSYSRLAEDNAWDGGLSSAEEARGIVLNIPAFLYAFNAETLSFSIWGCKIK